MRDIATITDEELKKDLDETYSDIINCKAAIRLGITAYAGGESVRDRLETNERIRGKIEFELARRKSVAEFEAAKLALGKGRPWNPFKGGFVPYNRKAAASRLEWQRDQAAVHLAKELSKPAPRTGRVKALKNAMRLAARWRQDWIRLLKIVNRCDLRYIPAELAKTLEKWPDDPRVGTIGLDYLGAGTVAIFEAKLRIEMGLSKAVWDLRRADSEIRFMVTIYGDVTGLW
jgi:hypothetical protein